MTKHYIDFGVTPYALADVCEALFNNGVTNGFLTKEDGDIHVRWEYDITRNSPEKQGEQVIDANKMIEQEWSEKDEKIRNAIICYIGYGQHCGVSNIDMIAWLEKKGNDSYLQEKIESSTNAHKGEDPEGIIAACRGDEEQGEHKPANEPKFKVGDTIRLKNSLAEFTIESISDGRYYFTGSSIDIIACDRDYYKLAVPKLSNVESIGENWSEELADKTMIDKACDWLFSHFPLFVSYYDNEEEKVKEFDRSEFIKKFRKAMEG